MAKKKIKEVRCDPRYCGLDEKLEKFMDRISEVIIKLTDGQVKSDLSIQKLIDQGKFVEKLDSKIDRVEAKVDKNSQMVWKMVGIGMATAIVVPVILAKMFG